MKKICSLFLILTLALTVASCGNKNSSKTGVAFYYRSTSLSGSGLQAEYREEFSAKDDLTDVLRAYILGPSGEALISPFRPEHRVLTANVTNDTVYIVMSTSFANLQGLDLVLACSCLTVTSLELTGAKYVCISAEGVLLDGQKAIVLDLDSLVLTDDSPNLQN